jgi:TfoX/Sxy family transcriptional regulator of competence genes
VAYDEGLAERIRDLLADEAGVAEKRMFGGLCFLLHGNMCLGVVKDELMVRAGPDAYESLLELPHARKMDFTGRPMKGMPFVGADGVLTDRDLASWVSRGVSFARSLPAKVRPSR